LKEVIVTGACENDQSFKEHLNHLEKGALYLQDLGYFSLESFQVMDKAGSYFISRYLFPTKIFNEKDEPIHLLETLKKTNGLFSRWVRIGSKAKRAVRLIAQRLEPSDYEKRLRKLHKSANKKGRAPTPAMLELARWSIYITNAPEEMCPAQYLHLLYSWRWQKEFALKDKYRKKGRATYQKLMDATGQAVLI